MIYGAPQIVGLAAYLHKDLVEMPTPLGHLAKLLGPALTDLAGHKRPEPVPPVPYRLVADVDAALMEQVLHVPQRQWEADIHHHRQTDDLGRSLEVADRIAHPETLRSRAGRLKRFSFDCTAKRVLAHAARLAANLLTQRFF